MAFHFTEKKISTTVLDPVQCRTKFLQKKLKGNGTVDDKLLD